MPVASDQRVGIDVERVSHVINLDIPNTAETYTHRIGRTGRSEREGKAYTFVTEDDGEMIAAIEKMIGARLAVHSVPGFEELPVPHDTRGKSVRKSGPAARGSGPRKRGGRATRTPAKKQDPPAQKRPAVSERGGGARKRSRSRRGGRRKAASRAGRG